MMRRVKIGIVGFFHDIARDDIQAYERAVKEMEQTARELDFELYVAKQRVYNYEDGVAAVREMNVQAPDFTLLLSVSVIIGDALIPFAGLAGGIGLWSVPESTKDGMLPMNAFCGSMIFSGMLGKYFRERGIQFKWFYGYTQQPLFRQRFLVTLQALRAAVALSHSKIACIGPVVKGFDYMLTDEADIYRLYGTRIDRQHSVEEMVERAMAYSPAAAAEATAQMRSEGSCTAAVDDAALAKSARLYLALRDFAGENGFNALALSCWTRLREVYGIVPCAAVGRLNNAGITVACEGDVDGAIGMVMDKAMNGGAPASMVDLVYMDAESDCMNIWHCGPAPACMADSAGVRWDQHFNMGAFKNNVWQGAGVVADLTFRPGAVTLHRISSKHREMVAFGAEVFPRESFQGSSGWIRNFTMQGRPMGLGDMLGVIYNCQLDHHMAFGYGNCEDALLEFAAFKGLQTAKPNKYVDYMEPPGSGFQYK